MCPKDDQTPANTTSTSPTIINEETKSPSTLITEPKCKHCCLKKQMNPSPENGWISTSLKLVSKELNHFGVIADLFR